MIYLNIEITKAILEIAMMLIGAFLIGIIAYGLLIGRHRDEVLNLELSEIKKENDSLLNRVDLLLNEKDDLTRRIQELNIDSSKYILKNNRYQSEIEHNISSLHLCNRELDNLKQENEKLNNEIVLLKVENENLTLQIKTLKNIENDIISLPDLSPKHNTSIVTPDADITLLNLQPTVTDRNSNEFLETPDSNLTPLHKLINIIGTATHKDDLQQINGIGPFIEEKLNSLGITSIKQISKLDDQGIELLNELIQFFPGRIQRDKWIEQAKALIS